MSKGEFGKEMIWLVSTGLDEFEWSFRICLNICLRLRVHGSQNPSFKVLGHFKGIG